MGKKWLKETEESRFSLEGRFISFVGDVAKPKRLHVATVEGDRYIKLAKELRSELRDLRAGDWVQIAGKQKYKAKTGELKLKADQVKLTVSAQQLQRIQIPVSSLGLAAPLKRQACVMICQKSSCRKRGASEVSQAVAESLRDRGLAKQVVIKGTGCLKQCKQGPCVVVMPDKSRYSGVLPKDVDTLVDKHFTNQFEQEESKLNLVCTT